MALWQIRLGENKPKNYDNEPNWLPDWRADWRETHLAPDHCLITVDYGIKKDISNMTCKEIEKHIEEVQPAHKKNRGAIDSYIRQTLDFKNTIEKGDYFISPINYLDIDGKVIDEGSIGNYRIGQIISEKIGTLESLFEDDLEDYLKNYGYSNCLKKELTADQCGNIPTRKVRWLTDIFPKDRLNSTIEPKRYPGDIKGTVAKLTFAVHFALVKDPKTIPWIS